MPWNREPARWLRFPASSPPPLSLVVLVFTTGRWLGCPPHAGVDTLQGQVLRSKDQSTKTRTSSEIYSVVPGTTALPFLLRFFPYLSHEVFRLNNSITTTIFLGKFSGQRPWAKRSRGINNVPIPNCAKLLDNPFLAVENSRKWVSSGGRMDAAHVNKCGACKQTPLTVSKLYVTMTLERRAG